MPDHRDSRAAGPAPTRPGDRVFSGLATRRRDRHPGRPRRRLHLPADRGHPRARPSRREFYGPREQLLRLRRAAAVRHDPRRHHRAGRRGAARLRASRWSSATTRRKSARRPRSPTSSTCSPPCRRVVFGLWGISVLAPQLVPVYVWLDEQPRLAARSSRARPSGTGRTILTAGLVLAIMILPIITAISREVFAADPAPARGGRARPRRHPLGDDPAGGLPLRPLRHGLRRDARPRPRARRDDGRRDGALRPAAASPST